MAAARTADMDPDRLQLSTLLLRAVLAGMTYEAVAHAHGLTRTGVERRVKSLVMRLIRDVGIEGLTESQAIYVRKLRAHCAGIESALVSYVPIPSYPKDDEPRVLSDEEIQSALRRVRMHTETPERDVAMVWILLATGLRPLEVARMEIADYLGEDGAVRIQSEVRACVAVNRRTRPLYFSSAAARAAIDAYLVTRVATAGGGIAPYRGLGPRQALFLTQEGRAFKVEEQPTGAGGRFLCQEIHYAYRKIFRRIGVPGLSALNLRYTVMDRLARRGADESQIGELLGIRELRPAKRPRPSLDQLMDGLI